MAPVWHHAPYLDCRQFLGRRPSSRVLGQARLSGPGKDMVAGIIHLCCRSRSLPLRVKAAAAGALHAASCVCVVCARTFLGELLVWFVSGSSYASLVAHVLLATLFKVESPHHPRALLLHRPSCATLAACACACMPAWLWGRPPRSKLFVLFTGGRAKTEVPATPKSQAPPFLVQPAARADEVL